MNKINYKFERSNDKITPFGGISLLIPLLEKLGIRDYLDKELVHPGSNRGKPPSSKIIPVILSMICGGRKCVFYLTPFLPLFCLFCEHNKYLDFVIEKLKAL